MEGSQPQAESQAVEGDANAPTSSLSAQEQDTKTRAQVESINAQIRATQPLTSKQLHISNLSLLFDPNTNFHKGSKYLAANYKYYRAIRGDGNCYYRAFLYALCQKMLSPSTSTEEVKRIQDYAKKSIDEVVERGYDRFTIEMFHDEMVDLLDTVSKAKVEMQNDSNNDANAAATATASPSSSSAYLDSIHDKLIVENGTSDYCVWYLRVITSAYLKKDPERFIHFLDDPTCFDVETYCAKEVDPMGRECTMVGVLALAEAFGVCVHIEYMDGNPLVDNKLAKHSFGPEPGSGSPSGPVEVNLLYRPGHYDILYHG